VWISLCLGYVVVLWLTSMAGPLWALWLWSLVAFPLFVATLWRHSQQRPATTVIALVWLVLVVAVPFVVRQLETRGVSLPAVTEPFLTIILVTWPLIVTWLFLRLAGRLAA
jgi:hypothetical protein